MRFAAQEMDRDARPHRHVTNRVDGLPATWFYGRHLKQDLTGYRKNLRLNAGRCP